MHRRTTLGWAWACAALGRRHRQALKIGGAVRSASARRLIQAHTCAGLVVRSRRAKWSLRGAHGRRSTLIPVRLELAQRRTLEMGSCIVLSGVGLGFQLGGWPAWSLLAAAGVYGGWVMLYAEITVQAQRRTTVEMRSASAPQPAEEQSHT